MTSVWNKLTYAVVEAGEYVWHAAEHSLGQPIAGLYRASKAVYTNMHLALGAFVLYSVWDSMDRNHPDLLANLTERLMHPFTKRRRLA